MCVAGQTDTVSVPVPVADHWGVTRYQSVSPASRVPATPKVGVLTLACWASGVAVSNVSLGWDSKVTDGSPSRTQLSADVGDGSGRMAVGPGCE